MKALARKQGDGRESPLGTLETGLERFREEMERALDRVWRGGFPTPFAIFPEELFPPQLKAYWPAVDVAEDDKGIIVRADIPGLEAKDVSVEVSGNMLTIRGSREERKEEKTENVFRHERRFGKFERAIALPPYVDAGKVEARCENGTLTVTAPRIPGEGPRRVEVKSA